MASPPIFPPLVVVPLERVTDPCDAMFDNRVAKYEVPAAYSASGFMYDIGLYRPNDPVPANPIIAFRGRPLDRVTYYCARIRRGATGALPPAIRFDLRIGFNHVTTLAASIVVVPTSYDNDADWLFSFAGLTATQWELWAGVIDIGDPLRPAEPIQMAFDTLINWSGCCQPEESHGPWVVVP